MLTGDKLETAICIAKSSGLFSRNQNIHVFNQVTNRADAHAQLNALRRKTDNAMVITGDSLKVRDGPSFVDSWSTLQESFFYRSACKITRKNLPSSRLDAHPWSAAAVRLNRYVRFAGLGVRRLRGLTVPFYLESSNRQHVEKIPSSTSCGCNRRWRKRC